MKIGVIGIGNIGGTLARKFAASGHTVRVANSRGADAVKDFAASIGAEPTDVFGAASGVDAVILAIPLPAVAALPVDLFTSLPAAVPVIDTSNYYPDLRDPHIEEIDEGMPESVWVTETLHHPVIKAFNNVLADTLAAGGRLPGDPNRLASAVAGDNDTAKRTAMKLVSEAGFDPVDDGLLEDSWRQ